MGQNLIGRKVVFLVNNQLNFWSIISIFLQGIYLFAQNGNTSTKKKLHSVTKSIFLSLISLFGLQGRLDLSLPALQWGWNLFGIIKFTTEVKKLKQNRKNIVFNVFYFYCFKCCVFFYKSKKHFGKKH